ncbi:hypothetical protein ACFWIB_42730 [Streptomyces sp. NPDC127051]|uniref:hypothetical protein n=1 Tax=Streptomyces sp. NPDC127051 TaxID=3347119 RepID=UPI00366130AB
MDTPGWAEITPEQYEAGEDPLGDDRYGRLLAALLEQANDVIVAGSPKEAQAEVPGCREWS